MNYESIDNNKSSSAKAERTKIVSFIYKFEKVSASKEIFFYNTTKTASIYGI